MFDICRSPEFLFIPVAAHLECHESHPGLFQIKLSAWPTDTRYAEVQRSLLTIVVRDHQIILDERSSVTSRTAALVLWADPTSAPPLSILDFLRPLPLKNFCDARRSEILEAPNLQLYIPHNVCTRHNNTSSWYVCALTHTVILLTYPSGTAGQI
jgi:hypothetical protein